MRLESRQMSRFYDIDAANAAIPELDGIVAVLGAQRAELVRLRDDVIAAGSGSEGTPVAATARSLAEQPAFQKPRTMTSMSSGVPHGSEGSMAMVA